MTIDTMNWEKFHEDVLYNDNLVYFYNEWLQICREVKSGLIGIGIVNFRVLLNDIVNEYELNQFRSSNNRKVYIGFLENMIPLESNRNFRVELQLLKNYIEKKEMVQAYSLSKQLKERVEKACLAQVFFDELLLMINEKAYTRINRKKIQSKCRSLIIELITVGFEVDDVSKLMEEAFSDFYFVADDSGPIIRYPDVPSGLGKERALEYVKNLKISDRLDFIRNNIKIEKEEYIFIYPLIGIMGSFGDNRKVKLMDFTLYDPAMKKMLDDADIDESFIEMWDGDELSKKIGSRCNAYIEIYGLSLKSAKREVENKLKILLELLNWSSGGNRGVIYLGREYIAKNVLVEGHAWGMQNDSTVDLNKRISKSHPLKFDESIKPEILQVTETVRKLESVAMTLEANTLLNATALLGRSKQLSDEEKLLNYWISIESLANICQRKEENKFSFIKETVAAIYFNDSRFVPIRKLFDALVNGISLKKINLDPNLSKELGVDDFLKGKAISLRIFSERLEELSGYTDEVIFCDLLEECIEIYSDNKLALKHFKKEKEDVEYTIDYIYKTRNQIVHNGFVDRNIIKYLVKFALGYVETLLYFIIRTVEDGFFDLPQSCVNVKVQSNIAEKKLEEKKNHVDLMKDFIVD